MTKNSENTCADICLILEGSYPYVRGGVSSWTHQLIQTHSELTFYLVTIVAPSAQQTLCYTLPDNVLGMKTITLQRLQPGASSIPRQADFFIQLEEHLRGLSKETPVESLQKMIALFAPHRERLGAHILLNSQEAWQMQERMYSQSIPDGCFLDYFWSWRALYGGLFSMLLPPLPKARIYHALCTGYAGLFLARTGLETGCPCVLTEHGIYTNERRIEMTSADWLQDPGHINLTLEENRITLRDFWINTFTCYSKVCYEVCDKMVTLFEGNKSFQIADGANPSKQMVIPNGIDFDRLKQIPRKTSRRAPTVGMIGRVVPIKDVRTFIRGCALIKEALPDMQALIIGPTEEDEEYFADCTALVKHLELDEVLSFTGQVDLSQYLGQLDVVVLTSLSEAQPLVLLEAGAVGIPCVVTDVGSCREIVMGAGNESPPLGPGGGIAALSSPRSMATQVLELLTNDDFYEQCSRNIQARIDRCYRISQQNQQYQEMYQEMLGAHNDGRNRI